MSKWSSTRIAALAIMLGAALWPGSAVAAPAAASATEGPAARSATGLVRASIR